MSSKRQRQAAELRSGGLDTAGIAAAMGAPVPRVRLFLERHDRNENARYLEERYRAASERLWNWKERRWAANPPSRPLESVPMTANLAAVLRFTAYWREPVAAMANIDAVGFMTTDRVGELVYAEFAEILFEYARVTAPPYNKALVARARRKRRDDRIAREAVEAYKRGVRR